MNPEIAAVYLSTLAFVGLFGALFTEIIYQKAGGDTHS